MSREISDVSAFYLGLDEVDRLYIGTTLIWNGDLVPEFEADEYYYDWSSYTP